MYPAPPQLVTYMILFIMILCRNAHSDRPTFECFPWFFLLGAADSCCIVGVLYWLFLRNVGVLGKGGLGFRVIHKLNQLVERILV